MEPPHYRGKSEDQGAASVCQSSVGGEKRECFWEPVKVRTWEMETKTVSQKNPAVFLNETQKVNKKTGIN